MFSAIWHVISDPESWFWLWFANLSAIVPIIFAGIGVVYYYGKNKRAIKIDRKKEKGEGIGVVVISVGNDNVAKNERDMTRIQTGMVAGVNAYYKKHTEMTVGKRNAANEVEKFNNILIFNRADMPTDSEDNMRTYAMSAHEEFMEDFLKEFVNFSGIIHVFYKGPTALLPMLTWGIVNKYDVEFFYYHNGGYYNLGIAKQR